MNSRQATEVVIFVVLLLAAWWVVAFIAAPHGQVETADSDNYHSTAVENNIPNATGYVVDQTGLITQTTKDIITASEKARGTSHSEVAVLVVPTTGGMSIEEYGIRVGEKWKVGDADKDNGVIFILATEDRKVRIEVGRGAEAKLSDAETGRILDNEVIPFLKKQDWNGGVLAAYKAITVIMDK